MILPYKMETTFTRYPFTNAGIIAFTSIFHFLVMFQIVPYETSESMVLQEWSLQQLVGNIMLHGDIFHLLGNMLFLWIFGNAVCALVGNLSYFFIYIFLGICASASHLAFNGNPAIGASGAINGIVGMTLVFFPVNKLHSIFLFSIPGLFIRAGKFAVKTYWMILYWFVFDVAGIVFSGEHIAYWAHIGGFFTGIVTGLIILKANLFETYDATIVDVIRGNVIERETMSLDELEEKEQRRRKVPDELLLETPPLVETPELQPIISEPSLPPDASPIFRVLKIGKKDGEVLCYFINEGDKISNAIIQSQYQSEIQPAHLANKAPGWLRFSTHNEINLEQLQLSISFDAGTNRLTKQMQYDPAGKKFVTA